MGLRRDGKSRYSLQYQAIKGNHKGLPPQCQTLWYFHCYRGYFFTVFIAIHVETLQCNVSTFFIMVFIRFCFIWVFGCLFSVGIFGQDLPLSVRTYDAALDSLRLVELQESYGQSKVLPVGFELQALVALSHYPELVNVPIVFKFRKKKIAHTSRPDFWSILNPFQQRRYEIVISDDVADDLEAGMLKNMSYNAQIGVLGHELGHTAFYLDKSVWQLVVTGIRYANKVFRKGFENDTDLAAIDHNLGYQLLAWSETVHVLLEKAGRGENYLKPVVILETIREHGNY